MDERILLGFSFAVERETLAEKLTIYINVLGLLGLWSPSMACA